MSERPAQPMLEAKAASAFGTQATVALQVSLMLRASVLALMMTLLLCPVPLPQHLPHQLLVKLRQQLPAAVA